MQYQWSAPLNPPNVNSTKSSSTGSYKNLACILKGTFVLLMSKWYKKCTNITFDSINAKYFPIQLLGPAENGINEYGSFANMLLSFHLSGSNLSGFV
jgi:hypothetical protein